MEKLVDTHCHLNHNDFANDLDFVIHRAKSSGVTAIICVGYDLASSYLAVDLAKSSTVSSQRLESIRMTQ